MRVPLPTSPITGITREWEDLGGGNYAVHASHDPTALLERNKAMANHNDGYTPSREMRRVASIPPILILKWLNEEGLNVYDPTHADRLAKKLNSSDYAYLRTAPGTVAALPDGSLR